jgi:hypothetical protein
MKSPSPKTRRLYTLYRSTNPNKKFDVYVENPKTDRIKKVSFGARDYEDYTMHHDKERRERYRIRHKNDRYDNHLYPGFWSWHVLWGKSSSLKTAMDYTVRNLKKLSQAF